ncbi:hypothetical protein PgNI_05838 [Pyricularia grisea]|uniref:Uncharacterized protein n=1 Tax=Pyricularia grisea TaxID=148305 RepID=A0A6P8B5P0_PYRGI|nr:hypothetical protein PgNI_05838 [Pyricularia grisea]TLD10593.1 hypothetical protein PgNI_05838 [Pyricularia grisea]
MVGILEVGSAVAVFPGPTKTLKSPIRILRHSGRI